MRPELKMHCKPWREKELPVVMGACRSLQAAATSDGVLDAKAKKLMM
jgi:hypothetical protein